MQKQASFKSMFWVVAAFLFLAQLFFTVNSLGQLRYEEVAESIRNVFWLQKSFIYDGVSSNVGWYGLLLIVYNIFGFSVNIAKIVRLFLSLISIFSLAILLKKYLGDKAALVPLIAICLSPTMLYFNTLQASFGIDLQYLLICLYLVDSLNSANKNAFFIKESLLWLLAMIAWMSYPSFIFYLPVIGILYLRNLLVIKKLSLLFVHMAFSVTAFILPLLAAFLLISDKNLLIYDHVVGSGIFRGGGTFVPSVQMFFYNFGKLLSDIFIQATSYHFDLHSTEFSGIYPAIAVIFVLIFSIWLAVKKNQIRFLLLLIWVSILFEVIFANLTSGAPGMRRNTSLLAFIYALYTIGWYYLFVEFKANFLRVLGLFLLLLIPLHHLLVFPGNVSHLNDRSPFRYELFSQIDNNPTKTLDKLVAASQNREIQFSCRYNGDNPGQCQYAEIYAAIAGSCYWNHLNCQLVKGYDSKSGSYIYLNPDLWRNYYWSH
jgi:hypothetical protein